MFIENKYTRWYNNIIDAARLRVLADTYTEKHHIIPRCLGGTNSHDNLVTLTAREHFVCHLLLTKMTIGKNRYKMSKALTMIMSIRRIGERTTYIINGHWYARARILAHKVRADYWTDDKRAAQSIRTANYFATIDKTTDKYKQRGNGAHEYNLHKTWTEKAIASRLENCLKNAAKRKGTKNPEQSIRMTGTIQSVEANVKRSIALKGRKTSSGTLGHKFSEETKQKMSESQKNQPIQVCPHCNKSIRGGAYNRWHGDKCTLNSLL